MKPFFVYILKCNDESYYIGHTDDIEKRISEHANGKNCSYTASRLPVELHYIDTFSIREEALTAEQKIKRWSRKKKQALIDRDWDSVKERSKKLFLK